MRLQSALRGMTMMQLRLKHLSSLARLAQIPNSLIRPLCYQHSQAGAAARPTHQDA